MVESPECPEVIAMAGTARAPGRPLLRMTRFLTHPNKLRRRSDRIEALIVAVLLAAFLAVVAAAPDFGIRVYRSERVSAAHLYRATAILSQNGPTSIYTFGYGEAAARWRIPDGQWRSGMLTELTAPGIAGASAGTRVRIWLSSSGEPTQPPPSRAGQVSGAVILAFALTCGAGVLLLACYWLCRLALDRRRLAGWASDWAQTGPRWTTRQG
jgi:hypothetical protein